MAIILDRITPAIIDNIPIMFAVLSVYPEMPHVQWLLITLTCGVGGSLCCSATWPALLATF